MSFTEVAEDPPFEAASERLHIGDLFDLQYLDLAIETGLVRMQTHPTEPLVIYNYTEKDDRAQGMDREPEPPEDEPPLSLDVIEQLLDVVRTDKPFPLALRQALGYEPSRPDTPAEAVDLLLQVAVPQLLTMARYLERLPDRREYAVTFGRYGRNIPAPGNHVMCSTAELAFEVAGREAGTVWVRDVAEHPWVELVEHAPF